MQAHWIKVFGIEYRKLNNQARFVAEIIDNKLIVSKKSKSKLVEELRKKGYEAFPKVKDAKKAGETDDVVENTDEVGADEESGARDYDYLLGVCAHHTSIGKMLTRNSFLFGLLHKNVSTSFTSKCRTKRKSLMN